MPASAEVYATVQEYMDFLLDPDGDPPLDLEKGLREASRLFDRLPTVQARILLSYYPEEESGIRAALREAVCYQVEYWVEIAGGGEVDQSQDILRPIDGGWTRVGSVTLPPYDVVAPRAVQALQNAGWWNPNPSRVIQRFDFGRLY